jgi:hypothetical protein
MYMRLKFQNFSRGLYLRITTRWGKKERQGKGRVQVRKSRGEREREWDYGREGKSIKVGKGKMRR